MALAVRARLRAEPRVFIALLVLASVGLGASWALVGTARRTATAHDRFFAASRMFDFSTGYGPDLAGEPIEETFASATSDLDGLQQIVGFQVESDAFDATEVFAAYGFLDQATLLEIPAMEAGRLPAADAVGEVLLSDVASERTGLTVGDRFSATLMGVDEEALTRGQFTFFPADEVELEVVGVGVFPGMVLLDEWAEAGTLGLSPAFVEQYWDLRVWGDAWVRLKPGAPESAAIDAYERLGLAPDENRSITRQRVWQAIRPLVTTLAVAGAFAFASTLVLVVQALSRIRQRHAGSDYILRACGATPGAVRLAGVWLMLGTGLAAVAGGWAVAVALSPLAPVGPYRTLDPDGGVFVDGLVLGTGAVLFLGVIAAVAALGGRARTTVPQRPARTLGLPLSIDVGFRWAFDRVATGGSAVRSTLALTTALGSVVTAVVFVASLSALSSTPEWYGQAWEVWMRSPYGGIPGELLEQELGRDPDVDGWVAADTLNVLVDGRHVPSMVLGAGGSTQAWPTLVDGRIPQRQDEIVVGRETMEAIGADLGDRVTLTPQTAGDAGALAGSAPPPSRTGTIVGVGVFPAVGYPGVDPPRLGVGAAVVQSFFGGDDGRSDLVFIDLADGVDPAGFVARQEASGAFQGVGPFPTELLTDMQPAEVEQIAAASSLVWATAAGLGVISASLVGHLAVTTVSRRRRSLALLRALGFTGRQVGGVVLAQSLVAYAVGAIAAVVIGVAAGRNLWSAFARDLNVLARPTLPPVALAAVLLIGAGVVAFVSLPSALRARRVSVVGSLHGE